MVNESSGLSGRPARTSTDDAVQAARDEGHALKDQAREAAEQIRHGAREAAEDVKEQIHSGATRQKDAAAQQMDGWAHALMTASEDLQNRGQGSAAACVREAAAGLERASGTVRERSLDDLIGTVEDFARRQPVAFIGGAVAAGFGLARLMKSSADRRRGVAAGPGGGDRMGGGFASDRKGGGFASDRMGGGFASDRMGGGFE